MPFLKLALRNARRQVRRSLLILGVTSLGVLAMVLAWSVLDGQNQQMVRNMTEVYSAHAQLQRVDFLDQPSLDLSFPAHMAADLAGQPGVTAVSSRISGTGLLSAATQVRGVLLVGIDPVQEPQVTRLDRQIVQGHYLRPGERGGLLLGRSLATSLGVRPGDEVAVLAEGRHAAIGSLRLQVRGIFDTGNSHTDAQQAFLGLGDASELFGTEGEITSAALRLDSLAASPRLLQQLQAGLPCGLVLRDWAALLPSVAQSVQFHEGLAHLLMLILFVVVATGLATSLQMSVSERLNEYGTQLALGTTPWQLCRSIVYEGLLLSGLGFFIGYALAALIATQLAREGISLPQHGEALETMQGLGQRIHPYLDPRRLPTLLLGLGLVSLLATLLPAWRAARLTPLAALRGVWRERPPRRRSRRDVASSSSPRWPTLALAWRNVRRSPWRSALAGAALSLGLAAFIFVQALAAGFMKQMSDNTTGFVTADLQVQHPLFRHQMQPAWHFSAQEPWLARLRERPEVAGLSLRLQSEATVSSTRKAEAMLLVGMDAQAERQITRLHEAVVQGHLPARPQDAVLGKKLAERLDLHVGERLVAMAQGADGGLVSEAFVVSGILDTGAHGPDTGMVYIDLARARQLLGQPGSASAALVRLQHPESLAAQRAGLQALLPTDGSRQLMSWQELVPEVAQTVNLVKHGVLLILAIVFLMVATIAMNSLLMSVMERSREFGTLMSLGASPRTLLRLVAGEAGVLAALGAGAGLLMGGALVAHYAWTGLRLRAHGAESLGLGDIVHPQFSGPAMLGAAAVLCLLVLLASLVPALRIGRREPVAALRQP